MIAWLKNRFFRRCDHVWEVMGVFQADTGEEIIPVFMEECAACGSVIARTP